MCFKYPGYPTTVNPGTPTPTSTQPPGTNNLRFCQSVIIFIIFHSWFFIYFYNYFSFHPGFHNVSVSCNTKDLASLGIQNKSLGFRERIKSLKNVVSDACHNCLEKNVFRCIEKNCMAPLGGPCQPAASKLPLVTDHVRCETCAEQFGCSLSVCTNPNSLRLHHEKGMNRFQLC